MRPPAQEAGSRHRRGWRIAQFFGELSIAAVAVSLLAWWLLGGNDCSQEVIDTQIAGHTDRFAARFATADSCEASDVNGALIRNFIVVLTYCSTLAAVLYRWWNASWDSEPGKSRIRGIYFTAVAGAAVVLSAAGNAITGIQLDIEAEPPALGWAALIATLGWGKLLLVGILGAATIGMVLSWCVRGVTEVWRSIRDTQSNEAYTPESHEWVPEGKRGYQRFAIALSGGGIRSAAFSLGAMSALEDSAKERDGRTEPLLDQAALLATVSGGGYTGTAWRIAAGEGLRDRNDDGDYVRLIGDPNRFIASAAHRAQAPDDGVDPGPFLAQRLRERRLFLRNGRGGLALSFLRLIVQLAVHLALLLCTVGVLAWPVGRFISSWAITTPGVGIEYRRLVAPALYALVVFGGFVFLRLFTMPGTWRKVWDGLAVFFAAVAAGLALGLVVTPWLVVELLTAIEEVIPGGGGAQSTVALILTSGVAASVWRALQAPLRTRAPYLGGLLLLISLLLFALLVASEASGGASDLFFVPDTWWQWGLAVVVYVALLSTLNPDLWSLHPIYAGLLRGTFENRFEAGQWTDFERGEWPTLSSFATAAGPHPVICAAAARDNRLNTGLSVVSMTFEPDFVTVHRGAEEAAKSRSVALRTADYENLFGGRTGNKRLRSIIGMAALSAAAVAPSLGRASMGSTDSLIAALNLRLGAWLPNPVHPEGERRIGPHMVNMFKELTGGFSLDEPNLYVTDGGHWENTALVELIRRKAGVIVAVDSSLNDPYTFSDLLEAVELARVECGAIIRIAPEQLAVMKPSNSVRPAKNWCIADIEYPADEPGEVPLTGRMLFLKAQASDVLPLDILRYSKEDPSFPNYSTANQMLTDREFSHLAVLGRESMIRALEEHEMWLFENYDWEHGVLAPHAPAGPQPQAVDEAEEIDIRDGSPQRPWRIGPDSAPPSEGGLLLPKKRASPTAADPGW